MEVLVKIQTMVNILITSGLLFVTAQKHLLANGVNTVGETFSIFILMFNGSNIS